MIGWGLQRWNICLSEIMILFSFLKSITYLTSQTMILLLIFLYWTKFVLNGQKLAGIKVFEFQMKVISLDRSFTPLSSTTRHQSHPAHPRHLAFVIKTQQFSNWWYRRWIVSFHLVHVYWNCRPVTLLRWISIRLDLSNNETNSLLLMSGLMTTLT